MSSNQKNLPENITQYRKVIKHLKAKYKSLEKTNQYLKNQISIFSTPASESDYFLQNQRSEKDSLPPLKNFFLYNHCFQSFLTSVKEKFGDNFSLEMVFRMLDCNYEGKIYSDALAIFLHTPLNLPKIQIVRISLILDENCNGFISKESFFKALDSFQCRTEVFEETSVSSNCLRFSIDDLLKQLAEKLCNLKMTPLKLFQTAIKSREASDEMTYEEFEHFWKADLINLKELDLKELNMFVNVFDQNYKGKFEKYIFVQRMNKFLKRLLGSTSTNKRYLDFCSKELINLDEENQKLLQKKKENDLKVSNEEENEKGDEVMPPNFNKNSQISKKIGKKETHLIKKESEQVFSHSKNNEENDILFDENAKFEGDQAVFALNQINQMGKTPKESAFLNRNSEENKVKNEVDINGPEILINAAHKSGKHLYLCFQAILEDSSSPDLGFTVNEIFSKLDYYYGAYLNKKAKIDILKSIDLNGNGVYDFQEVKKFFLESCQGKISVKTLLLIFAKELQTRKMKTSEIFILNAFDLESKLNLRQFVEEIKPIMSLEFSDISAIFLEICDENGEISLKNFIKIINSLRNDSEGFNEPKKMVSPSKEENHSWSLQVQNNNRIRSVLLRFSSALKEKKMSFINLFKRVNVDEKDKKNQNILKLAKLEEVFRRIFPEKPSAEITEFIKILDHKNVGMISLEEYTRIVSLEEEKIDLKPLTNQEKEEVKEILNQFLDKKGLNLVQFFDILDKNTSGVLDLSTIKEGLLSQGFTYVETAKLINIFDLNHDGFVEKNEFLDSLAFKNNKKVKFQIKNTPIQNYSGSVVDKNEIKSDTFKKTALKKIQALIYTKEFAIIYSKNFGKYEGIQINFAVSRQEFFDFLNSIPKSAAIKNENTLSKEEITWLCQQADSHRKNRIKLSDFFEFIKTLNFESNKIDENEKIQKFLEEESKNDPFLEDDIENSNRKHSNRMILERKDSNRKDSSDQNDSEKINGSNKNEKEINLEKDDEKKLLIEKENEKIRKKKKIDEENKKILEAFLENQKKYRVFEEEKIKEISKNLKITFEDLNKLKNSKSDLFINEGRYYLTIFLNPIICLKRCIKDALDLKDQEKWKDPEFGPSNADPLGINSLFKNPHKKPSDFPDFKSISWKRLEEIVGFPVFSDKQKPFQSPIIQGELGNSWFLGALFLLSSQKNLIIGPENSEKHEEYLLEGVYPKIFHFLRYYGIYVFRFYKAFQWIYVVIDDRLPCIEIQKQIFSPIFGGSENNAEFWVALIEKAYAKLHYSYESLESGHLYTALKDMTGFFIKNLAVKYSKPDESFFFINEFMKRNALISCSRWGNAESKIESKEDFTGLKQNIVYKVLSLFELEDKNCKNSHKSHRLFFIHNPVPSEQIQGIWGYNSAKFKSNENKLKELPNFHIERDNFLIRFKDFRSFFDEVYAFCRQYKESRIYLGVDEWTKSNSGGPPIPNDPKTFKNWLKNPKYFFQITKRSKEKTNLFIELSQSDPRLLKKAFFPFSDEMTYLFFMVMKQEDMKKRKIEKFDISKMVFSSNLVKSREVSDEITLENGGYVLIVNSNQNGAVGKFMIKIMADCFKEEIKFFEEKIKDETETNSLKINEKDRDLLNKIHQECA